MKKMKFVMLIISLVAYAKLVNAANDTLPIRYAINEEWYFQAQGGISYMAAENTRFVGFWKVLSPQISLSLGKYFTPVWGVRLQLVGGRDKGGYYAHDKNSPTYSFGHYGVVGIGSFNITNCINRNKSTYNNRLWNVNALFGIGALYSSFGFTKNISGATAIDLNNDTYLSLFAGVEVARKITRNLELNIELSSNWMDNKFNGQRSVRGSGLNFDGMVNLLIGVRYTFNRTKKVNKTSVGSFSGEPYIVQSQQAESKIEPNIVVDKPKQNRAKPMTIYYSVEELLEMVDNGKSIRDKRLAKTEIISFDYGENTIKSFNLIYLDKVAELMKKSNIVLMIRGFSVDESVLNDRLAQQRIKAVRDYLIKCGIDRDRLVYQCVEQSKISQDDKDKGEVVELEILSL